MSRPPDTLLYVFPQREAVGEIKACIADTPKGASLDQKSRTTNLLGRSQ